MTSTLNYSDLFPTLQPTNALCTDGRFQTQLLLAVAVSLCHVMSLGDPADFTSRVWSPRGGAAVFNTALHDVFTHGQCSLLLGWSFWSFHTFIGVSLDDGFFLGTLSHTRREVLFLKAPTFWAMSAAKYFRFLQHRVPGHRWY